MKILILFPLPFFALAEGERARLAEVVETVEGVESVRVVSKQEAMERFRAGVGRGGALLDGLGENPLPASLEITLVPERRSPAGMAVVVEALTGLPGIDELASGQDWVEGYLRFVALIRGLAFGLGAILVLATLLIVANTIRLAFYARRDELDILALVGASRTFVRVPFLLEGTVQGFAGGLLALLVVWGTYELVLPEVRSGLELLVGRAELHFFSGAQAAGLVGAGAGLGLLGAITALAGWRGES